VLKLIDKIKLIIQKLQSTLLNYIVFSSNNGIFVPHLL